MPTAPGILNDATGLALVKMGEFRAAVYLWVSRRGGGIEDEGR